MKVELQTVFKEFENVLSEVPSRMDISFMRIDVGESKLISQVPYRLLENIKHKVTDEIRSLEQASNNVKLSNPLSSSVLQVRKPDGSIHLCVDYIQYLSRINVIC